MPSGTVVSAGTLMRSKFPQNSFSECLTFPGSKLRHVLHADCASHNAICSDSKGLIYYYYMSQGSKTCWTGIVYLHISFMQFKHCLKQSKSKYFTSKFIWYLQEIQVQQIPHEHAHLLWHGCYTKSCNLCHLVYCGMSMAWTDMEVLVKFCGFFCRLVPINSCQSF